MKPNAVIGLLYAGEMGVALAAMLSSKGARVVTTLQGRGPSTGARCRAAGLAVLGSPADVAAEADVVLSVVPPAAAEDVARAYCEAAHVSPPDALYVDVNSIRPAAARELSRLLAGHDRGFVDAAVNGLAVNAAASGTLFLSGPRAGEVEALFSGAIRTQMLGEDAGAASAMKMLLGGLSKGLCALFLELALTGEEYGMLGPMLQACGRIYPGVLAVAGRMLPTYPRHADRRATETAEVERTVREAGLEPCVTAAVSRFHEGLAAALSDAPLSEATADEPAAGPDGSPWSAESLIQYLAGRGWPAGGASPVGAGGGEVRAAMRAAVYGFDGEVLMASKPRSAEMHPGPGFRVRMNCVRLTASEMAPLAQFPTPDISDQLNRLYAVNPEIRRLCGPAATLCGPACTVKVFPGDNLMVHKSLDVAEPGDVVVVDAGGLTMNAVLGDLICTKARHRGIAGFIVDGLVRDLPDVAALDFPVYARGTTPIGPLHRGPGEINYPICCGGVVVNPGDVVVADAAGVVVIPRGIAADLLERLEEHKASMAAYLDSVKRGDFSNAWVDRLLAEQQCPVVRGAAACEPVAEAAGEAAAAM